MKLTITRNQSIQTDRKGRSEGAIFSFACQLYLDQHEQELVEQYRQERYPVTFLQSDDVRDYNPRNPDDRALRLDRLTAGWSVESKFASDLLRAEAKIREDCANFSGVLKTLESYEGQEDVEF